MDTIRRYALAAPWPQACSYVRDTAVTDAVREPELGTHGQVASWPGRAARVTPHGSPNAAAAARCSSRDRLNRSSAKSAPAAGAGSL